jgi:tetratricopeptide (TPR) repeat protein
MDMEGHRWLHRCGKRGWWGSFLCFAMIGCNHSPVQSPLDAALQTPAFHSATNHRGGLRALWGHSPQLSVQLPHLTSNTSSQGPPKPETIAILAQVQLDAAFAEETSPASRELLLDQARQGFQKALQQDPKNPTALLGLAQYHARLGERQKALEVYHRYLQYYPQDIQVRHQLALVHAQWKDWESAVRWCDEALRLDPESRNIRKTKGFCLARAGRYDEALTTFREIMPESLARYHLARVLEHMGQVEASQQQLHLALQSDPNCEQARQFLTEIEAAYSIPKPSNSSPSVLPAGHLQSDQASPQPPLSCPEPGHGTSLLPLGTVPLAPAAQK